MKKIIAIILMLVMLCTFATAQTEIQNKVSTQQLVQAKFYIDGAELGMVKAKTHERVKELEQLMVKVSEQNQLMLQKLNNVEVADNLGACVKGTKESELFGIFKVERTIWYSLKDDGELKQRFVWLNMFWRDVE